MNRKTELENEIKKHNQLYWEENNPVISDEEYDLLVQELKLIDPDNKLFNKIHEPVSAKGRKKVKHDIPMLSLDKVYSFEELIKWCASRAREESEVFIIEPKYDGLSCVFNADVLATSGDDGVYGLDISDKIPFIKLESVICDGLLYSCQFDIDIRIVGEIIVKKSDFKQYKEFLKRKDGNYYKTERNAAVGIIGQKETSKELPPVLTLIDYDKYGVEYSLKDLKNLNWTEFVEGSKTVDYPLDGLVIKLKDKEYSKSLGATSHHPRGQIAYKFGNPIAETKVINVIWSMGKNSLTPVAEVEPVILLGHEIRNANLHNAKRVLDLDLHINDRVIIQRCGEIIPDIVKVIPSDDRIPIEIETCPICNSEVTYEEPNLICSNEECDGKLTRKLTDSIKRLNIDNISTSTVEKLVKMGFISKISDIFTLKKQHFLNLEGYGEKSATNAIQKINQIRNRPIHDYKVLASLNLKGIGETLSKQLLKEHSLEELINIELEDLEKIPQMGPERAYILYIGLFDNADVLASLMSTLNILSSKELTQSSNGSICITGKVPNGKEYWHQLALQHNYVTSDNVTKELTYLICDNPDSTSSKVQKAKKYGINVITTDEFNKLLKNKTCKSYSTTS
jgi:DNA ligase (NAD+)